MSEQERLGVIGLGTMGGAFARNLMANGFPVVGYGPDPDAAARFADGRADEDSAAVNAVYEMLAGTVGGP